MKKLFEFFFITIILLCSQKSIAQTSSIDFLLRSIDRINDPDFEIGYLPHRICTTTSCHAPVDMIQQCAIDLCGLPNKHVSTTPPRAVLNNENFHDVPATSLAPLLHTFETEFEPLVQEIMEQRFQIATELYDITKQNNARIKEQGRPEDPALLEREEELRLALENPVEKIFKGLQECKSFFVLDSLAFQKVQAFNSRLHVERFLQKVIASSESQKTFRDHFVNETYIEKPQNPIENFRNFLDNKKRKDINRDNLFSPSLKDKSFFNVCPAFRDMDISDSASSWNTKPGYYVEVSWFSTQFLDHPGQHFFTHELGHVLSFQFKQNQLSSESYAQYMELRTCAQNLYKQDDTEPDYRVLPKDNMDSIFESTHHAHDKYHTEEHTADLWSYFMYKDDANISMCGLLDVNSSQTEYDSPSLEVFNLDTNTSHPPLMWRVLMEAIHKRKKFSRSCQQVIETYKDRINFTPCF